MDLEYNAQFSIHKTVNGIVHLFLEERSWLILS
jgi:hypothetical protein